MTENITENVTQDVTAIETVDTSHGVIVGPSSKHREKCEVLLKECLNGSYAKMPEFATEAWHYLSEAVEPNVEPVKMVHNLGVRAAHLMKVCSDIEAEKTSASTPKKASILETALIFMCGAFITHPRLWSICSALFLNRAIAALDMNINLQYSVSIVVGAHVYIVQKENWLIAALHMAAWIITWMWATRNPVL